MNFYTQQTPEGPAGDWDLIQAEANKHLKAKITVEEYNHAKEISLNMIRWWKGVLLPALSRDTGDSLAHWETRLKLAVMPEFFKPYAVVVNGMAVNCLPSIANMPMCRAIELVDGSVTYLHEQEFAWVQPPDPELRT